MESTDSKDRLAELRARGATPEGFARFGAIIDAGMSPVSVNQGSAVRHDVGEVTRIDCANGRLVASLFEVEAHAIPMRVDLLECHPLSAQAIVPMNVERYVAITAMSWPNGEPNPATLTAFWFRGDQGLIYGPGVWHHPIIAVGRRSRFFVQSWQEQTERDCLLQQISPVVVSLEPNVPRSAHKVND